MAVGFQIAIAVLSNLPGAASALKGLIDDIRGHGQLTDAEKAQLIAAAQKKVDEADERLQKL